MVAFRERCPAILLIVPPSRVSMTPADQRESASDHQHEPHSDADGERQQGEEPKDAAKPACEPEDTHAA